MENVSHTLVIVGSVLLSLLVISLAVYVFSTISSYQKSQEEVVSRESITTFNQEFEVYNKELMYGTDVLSCLNKAENNNEQYVYGVYDNSSNGGISDELVQVNVTINSTLQEQIKVYYTMTRGTSSQTSSSKSFNISSTSNYDRLFSTSTLNTPIFEYPTVKYYYFNNNTEVVEDTLVYSSLMWSSSDKNSLESSSATLSSKYINTLITAGTYSLVSTTSSSGITNTARLMALLSTVTSTEYTTVNEKELNGVKVRTIGYASETLADYWNYATWVTAAYDFKTRKFKCTGITYSDNGYVNSISFVEVNSY